MTEKKQSDKTTARSSISVSQEVVCEDDACIGKVANSESPTPDATEHTAKKNPTGASMAVGGKEICADDACIGKN